MLQNAALFISGRFSLQRFCLDCIVIKISCQFLFGYAEATWSAWNEYSMQNDVHVQAGTNKNYYQASKLSSSITLIDNYLFWYRACN